MGVLLGLSGNKPSQVRADDIVLKQLDVRGSLSSEPEDWQAVTEMLSCGAVQSIVTHTVHGLDRYEEAIAKVRSPPDGMLKLQLLPDPSCFVMSACHRDSEPEAKRAKKE